MRVQEIWRYPVKSMAGERLSTAQIGPAGVAGDRMIQVRSEQGRLYTARTRPKLLRHRGTLTPEGDALVDGLPWQSDEVRQIVESAAGAGARLVQGPANARFDILPLLVATDGMLQAVGVDTRRFRPNLVISGVPGLAEREWEGAALRIGPVLIGMEDLRGRCITTTYDPDTGAQDVNVLRRIQREFQGVLGLNSYVIEPGRVSEGDEVELIQP
ncbi:MOSC domain-containing protein [Paludibaculum fermentans]|uniref:MOSC domain-containing protein n=1 Tax=Paludibaculum fermentans TaxID=1473598 RepID=UPI003EBC104A